MMNMAAGLQATVSRWIRSKRLLQPGERVAVAVSGGSDSLALLLLLESLAPRLGLQLAVLHFDHQLRPESAQEARFVEDLARVRSLECRIGCEDVRERMRRTGRNLEDAARRARYEFFRQACDELQAACLATGHTADDQAETVLFHLLRGSGPLGLAGIRPSGVLPASPSQPELRLIRPLLQVRREDLRSWLREQGQEWIEDPSNALLDRTRNRIRHQLLPQLCREYNPALVVRLGATADILRAEEAAWEAAVAQALPAISRSVLEDGRLCVELDPLRRLPLGLRRRVLRALVAEVQGDLRKVDFQHLELLLEWVGERAPASGEAGRGMRRVEFSGIAASVSPRRLWLGRRFPRNLSPPVPV